MKVQMIAVLVIRLLAVSIFATSLTQMGRSAGVFGQLSLFEEIKIIIWTLSFAGIAAGLLWALAGKIANLMFKEYEQTSEVSINISEDSLLRVFVSLIGLQLLVYAIPTSLGQGIQLFSSGTAKLKFEYDANHLLA